ncbi:hypothetical protein BKA58DRAFT_181568 [Alternaria rosae]|uniref:uncharacterized protein n=1 Tax=Alternaria rosae TaxID=1187941 RepID=UPI001E8CEDF7|nr:uncharacterized protein BKA58DRAFT_181568 [Alternaria rosae]KAH6870693.1 hypothetical protein BKA58DRAFT_181568 [Alternaria rosae]
MASPINIKNWSPFKIDALGMVMLLGADAIRKSTDRLVYSPLEYLPFLAGHIFADNSVMEPVPGFELYNVTEAFKATDLSAWFTRWLSCQKLSYNSSRHRIQAVHHVPGSQTEQWLGTGLAVVVNAFLIIWPMLIEDWYGLAASFSLVALVVIRACILYDFRDSIDEAIKKLDDQETKKTEVKLFITSPNGKRLTVVTMTGIAQEVLPIEARPRSENLHLVSRAFCWLAFGVHAVTLGMTCLAIQLLIITVTLVSSVAMIQGWFSEGSNSNDTCIRSRLLINRQIDERIGSMSSIYVLLDLTEEEDQNMIAWSIFPTQHNKLWLPPYEKFKEDFMTTRDPKVLKTWGKPVVLRNRCLGVFERSE